MSNSSSKQRVLDCPFCGSSGEESPHWKGHYGCMNEACGAYKANLTLPNWNMRPASETEAPRSFQDRVFDWARECFGEHDTADPQMRTYRFLEEAIELAQACGCTQESAARVLTYVYERPTGVVAQEVGGVMVSLAVLCRAFGMEMDRRGEAELTRVLGMVEHIRARHAAKPDFAQKTSALHADVARIDAEQFPESK